MPKGSSPLRLLASLLSGYAKPVIDLDRLAPSSVYDLDYRIAIVALAFEVYSKPFMAGVRRIRTGELKLVQFIAQRPWLLPVIHQWSNSRRDHQASLYVPQHLRRGYLADTMFDDVIDFLIARGSLVRGASHLIEGTTPLFRSILNAALQGALFTAELEVLNELRGLTVTNEMLEGS
jgi:hypothetical protein